MKMRNKMKNETSVEESNNFHNNSDITRRYATHSGNCNGMLHDFFSANITNMSRNIILLISQEYV